MHILRGTDGEEGGTEKMSHRLAWTMQRGWMMVFDDGNPVGREKGKNEIF
jgi:hypothetical protein